MRMRGIQNRVRWNRFVQLFGLCVRFICGNQGSAGGGDLGLASPDQPVISEMSGWLLGRRVRYWERGPSPPQKRTGLGWASSLPAQLPSLPASPQSIKNVEVLMGRRGLCVVTSSLMVIPIKLA